MKNSINLNPQLSMHNPKKGKAQLHPVFSVLVPIYNEEDSIPILCEQLFSILDSLKSDFEIITVNDGSKDNSLEKLLEVSKKRSELKIINFARNYGQTAALMAAIDYASGDILIPIDADLQNDPKDIPRLLDMINKGYDVVSGWRKNRKDAALRRNFVSRLANWLISYISGVRLHDYGCTLKAYRKEVIKDARLYGEMHRFIPIYASWLGAKVTEIPVEHHPRKFGKSNYGLERIIKVFLDLLVVKYFDRYLTKPIYVFGSFGLLSIGFSGVLLLIVLYLKIFEGISIIRTPLPLLTTMSFLVGVISILLGLVAEIQVRTYFESQKKSIYQVRRTYNFRDKTK